MAGPVRMRAGRTAFRRRSAKTAAQNVPTVRERTLSVKNMGTKVSDMKRKVLSLLLLTAMLLPCGCQGKDPVTPPSGETDAGNTEPAETGGPQPKSETLVENELPPAVFGAWADNFVPGERSGINSPAVTFDAETGLYVRFRGAVEIDGPRTYASVDRPYSPAMYVNVDAYACSPDYVKSFSRAGYGYVGQDSSANKSGYGDGHPAVLQRGIDGATDGFWNSVVLTEEVIKDNNRTFFTQAAKNANWWIGFAEPEMFRDGLYGDGYKQIWEAQYGFDWEDPASSVYSLFSASKLNIWTHTHAIRSYLDAIHKKNAAFDNFAVAPHSTVSYAAIGVTDGYVHMMGTGLVGTVTGQTWSNTIETAFRYGGQNVKDTFINGLIDYGTYLDAADYYGADFYALCDPMSDTASVTGTEDYWRELCHQQLVASLMYSGINRWQFIWTNRSFMNVSADYRTEQLNIHNAIADISGKPFSMTSGTPGITYLLGDTLTWQNGNTDWGKNARDGFFGVTAPLLYDGILVETRAMELVTSKKDLEGVSLLIVSYDNQKPLYEETNAAIAEFVKDGGTLLYIGGPDKYLDNAEAWWSPSSPTEDLLSKLGLDGVQVGMLKKASTLVWKDGTPEGFNGSEMTVGSDKFTYAYSGTGFTPFLETKNGDVIGMEAQVGAGRVVMVGLPTADLSASASGAALMRGLTKLALTSTEYSYVTSDYYLAERGDYTAVYPLRGTYTLKGTYVDIFSSDLRVVKDPVVAEKEAALYYRAEDTVTAPRVLYHGGVRDALTEGNDKTEITVHAAENALIPIRIAAPEGVFPASVTAEYEGGGTTGAAAQFDEETGSLLVTLYTLPTSPAKVTVTWGGDRTAMRNTHYVDGMKIPVNASGADEKYIVSNSGAANGNSRYCDRAAQIVWKFDTAGYEGLQIAVSVVSNYIVEVSRDGQKYTVAADYSKMSTQRAAGTNNSVILITADTVPGEGDEIYIRLRNTDTSQGWGGAISQFAFRYLEEIKE